MQAIQETKICTKCGEEKPLSEFYKTMKRGKLTHYSRCKPCSQEDHRMWKENNKIHISEYSKRYGKNYYDKNREKRCADERERRRKYRLEAFEVYGGAKCVCCGEEMVEFLAIDHIDGGGTRHRRELHSTGDFCYWLKRNGWPPGYRVLCHNCNQAIGYYKICPHQTMNTDCENESQ